MAAPRFALNHILAPRLDIPAFMALAHAVGVTGVEIRNDLPMPLDATGPAAIRATAARLGLTVLSINALQRFNDWNAAREAEARALAAFAQACGAEALVLVPVNDPGFVGSDEGLRQALSALRPILEDGGLIGLVEPLGFAISSLRSKQVARDAIAATGGPFRLVHDTFHHTLAGEPALFPAETGLVHASGVVDPDLAIADMRDAHRVLVDEADRLNTIAQVRTLLNEGYAGFVSFEPFARSVQDDPAIIASLQHSMAAITAGMGNQRTFP